MGNTPASEAEPFGEEALAFTKDRCLQREVSIQAESVDKAGNFIGWLWVNNANLSVSAAFSIFLSSFALYFKPQTCF